MPDGDKLRFSLTAHWRKVLRSLERQDASTRTEDLVVKAVAATMRERGGVPDLQYRAAAVHRACSTDDPVATYRASQTTVRHDPMAQHADQAALIMASNMHSVLKLVSPAAATELYARKVLERVALSSGLDRMTRYLVKKGLYTAPQLNELFGHILDGGQLDKLAKSLTHHPDGDGLRAPRKASPTPSLDDLLETDMEDI